MESFSYKDSGVDVNLGGDVSKILYNAAKETWKNRKGKLGEVIVPFDDFSGIRYVDVSNLPNGTVMSTGLDGVGTKIEIAERTRTHYTIAHDLLAMVCDDAVIRGAEPVLFGSILDVNSLTNPVTKEPYLKEVNELAKGYINAAREADVAILNGELAELGDRINGYGGFNYNWGASCIWFAKKDRVFTGRDIKAGDYLVGLKEDGFRSNGFSLVRKILENEFGREWHKKRFRGKNKEKLNNLGNRILIPSKIYCKAVCEMFGGYDREPKAEIHGAAHITGEGIPGKLGRTLKPSGLGAYLNDSFQPSELMLYLQEKGNTADEEAYKTWNMGQGMIIITPEPKNVIKTATKHGIESKIIGGITRDPKIIIMSKGINKPNKELIF
jgi:phosphoribosylformylglycinamidine cyclo-ligase